MAKAPTRLFANQTIKWTMKYTTLTCFLPMPNVNSNTTHTKVFAPWWFYFASTMYFFFSFFHIFFFSFSFQIQFTTIILEKKKKKSKNQFQRDGFSSCCFLFSYSTRWVSLIVFHAHLYCCCLYKIAKSKKNISKWVNAFKGSDLLLLKYFIAIKYFWARLKMSNLVVITEIRHTFWKSKFIQTIKGIPPRTVPSEREVF